MTSSTMFFKIRRLVMLGIAMVGWPALAHAAPHSYTHYWLPLPKVIPPPLLEARGEYFSRSPGGVQELCTSHPELCAHPDLQARLRQLKNHQTAAHVLFGAAGACFVGGMAYALKDGIAGNDHAAFAIYGGMGLSAALIIAAVVVTPGKRDFEQFVNSTNARQSDSPVKWHFGLLGSSSDRALALGGSF